MKLISHLTLSILFNYNLTHNNATECVYQNGVCTFVDLLTTESNLYFNASSVNNDDVLEIRFGNSIMHTLTDELCSTFPNLQKFYVEDLNLKFIARGALDQCQNLHILSVSYNKLKTLDIDLFKGNPKLTMIMIVSNLLKEINGRMFEHVPELQTLNLADNFLTDFPVHQFPILFNLSILSIFQNDLRDLDDKEMVHKFPNLNTIYMHNNVFDCNRLEIILKTFQSEKITPLEWAKHMVTRNTNLKTINKIECIEVEETTLASSVKSCDEKKSSFIVIFNGALLGLDIILLVHLGRLCFQICVMKKSMKDE